MSLLHPGGFRGRMGMFDGRIFGPENIRRAIVLNLKGRDTVGRTSVAAGNRRGGPHEHNREISRRLRQAAKRAA